MQHSDLVVIGAGPAGMAAAVTAANAGLSVTVLDEQPRPGGQIYRDVDRTTARGGKILGKEYIYGKRLTTRLNHEQINHITGAVVWSIEEGYRISYSCKGQAAQVETGKLIIATGAQERAMPIPGWTLPGVMSAGAGQIMLKQSGVLARHSVLVGSGPLLYLIGYQMLKAGTPPLALVETQSLGDMSGAIRHIVGALRGGSYLAKGLTMLTHINRSRVPRYTGATDIAIEGDHCAEAISFTCRGKARHIDCSTVFLHHGVVTNTQVARSLSIAHKWNEEQQCFHAVVDRWGQTELPGVFITGDSARIGGAKVAELDGRLAALKVAEELGKLSESERNLQTSSNFSARAREMAIRPFLDAAYPPYPGAQLPDDNTIICRCEEVTAGDIRQYALLGCLGPNQTKAFGRAGMGLCQGRYCGLAVTALLADANQLTPDETGYYRIRPPIKPVTLGELALMDAAEPCVPEQQPV